MKPPQASSLRSAKRRPPHAGPDREERSGSARRTGTSIGWICFSATLVVIGVLCERFLIVIPGLIHPPDLFPGMEVAGTVLSEGVVQYSVSLLEILQTLGVIGIIGFAFMVGLKVMPLAPVEAKAKLEEPKKTSKILALIGGQPSEPVNP